MKPERIQLHSDVGRALLLFWSYARWGMLFSTAGVIALGFVLGARRFPVVPLVYCAVFWRISRWATLNATRVFASTAGLEMPGRRHTVPWRSIKEVREIPFVGGLLLNVYRVTFDDGTAPLTCYGTNEFEHIIVRFKDSARHAKPRESAA